MTLEEFTQQSQSITAIDAFCKAKSVLRHGEKVLVSISGGSDSDIMLDLLLRAERSQSTEYHFVWFDTGLEYQATKDHIKFLEEKYNIQIERLKAEKPIPLCVRTYGVPFLSKQVSDYIERLQQHGFRWENEDFETLLKKYPRCKAALRWWCGYYEPKNGKKLSLRFTITQNKWLKEFLMQYPPDFPISSKCCYYAKKKVGKKALAETGATLDVIGVRKAEGGVRATAYKSCYTSCAESKKAGIAQYRPLFWFTNEDKKMYETDFGIIHSRCYTEYGFKRTGCVGCSFGKSVFDDLQIIERYEPRLYKAAIKIFGKSYEYTRKFRQFQKMMNEREKMEKAGIIQLELFGTE